MYIAKDKILLLSIITVCLLSISILIAQTQDEPFPQTVVPLSEKGVPFNRINKDDYQVDGFEVDTNGNYYFMARADSGSVLVKIDENSKVIYRRKYNQFYPGQLYFRDGELYHFDDAAPLGKINKSRNTLSVLDPKDGHIIKQYPNILKNKVNSPVWFTDTSVTLWTYNNGEIVSFGSSMVYLKFSLEGKYLGQVINLYDLPDYIYKEEPDQPSPYFLGRLNDTLVFVRINLSMDIHQWEYTFWLEDVVGKILSKSVIVGDELCDEFWGSIQEYWRLRNRSIYYLSRDGKNAVITQMPIDKLFPASTQVK